MKWLVVAIFMAGYALNAQQKPWTPEMCHVQQPHASKAYITYCLKASPKEYPMCSVANNDPREPMWTSQANGGGPVYFEVLDCSWHPGENPRDKKPQK